MIKVNNLLIEPKRFPDGTFCLMNFPEFNNPEKFNVQWYYRNEDELIVLMYTMMHLRANYPDVKKFVLYMPYVPNARMDRVHDGKTEVFTLKYFTEVINSLRFDEVYTLDIHSNVSAALINNIRHIDVDRAIAYTINIIRATTKTTNLHIFFPDEGAYKRYKDLPSIKGLPALYGVKVRNWKTGEIIDLNIKNPDGLAYNMDADNTSTVLMIDDIISYGGTMYHSAKKLKQFGFTNIYAYASHTEHNSLFDEERGTFIKALKDGTVELLYTTDSLFDDSVDNVYVSVRKVEDLVKII